MTRGALALTHNIYLLQAADTQRDQGLVDLVVLLILETPSLFLIPLTLLPLPLPLVYEQSEGQGSPLLILAQQQAPARPILIRRNAWHTYRERQRDVAWSS